MDASIGGFSLFLTVDGRCMTRLGLFLRRGVCIATRVCPGARVYIGSRVYLGIRIPELPERIYIP